MDGHNQEATPDTGMVDNDDHDCPICFERIPDDQLYTTPECGHKFHYACIIPWFRTMNSTCPYCRTEPNGAYPYGLQNVAKLWQRLARRKNCPPEVKKMCAKVSAAKRKYREHITEMTVYRRTHKEILNGFSKIRTKRYQLGRKSRLLERQLCALPATPLIALLR